MRFVGIALGSSNGFKANASIERIFGQPRLDAIAASIMLVA
jgi:hypothetical protein